jgi:hypothetical protein
MSYQAGDIVYPADLPKRFPCCVEQAEQLTTSSGSVQLLRLVPLEGPWPSGTVLVRLCEAVIPISPREAAEMYSVATSHARARASSPIDA